MFNWLRKKLGIDTLECKVETTDTKLSAVTSRLHAVECGMLERGFLRRNPRPQRYDEIERDRSRRNKAHA